MPSSHSLSNVHQLNLVDFPRNHVVRAASFRHAFA
jgi:hypothetical protein